MIRTKARKCILTGLSTFAVLASSQSVFAENNLIIGGDVMDMEVRLGYAQGSDVFSYQGTRFRVGMESDTKGMAFGLEYTPSVIDEEPNVVGTEFSLEVDDTIGIFFTAGSLAYFRLGWSTWKTEYTHLATGTSNWARSHAVDYGIGFKTPLGPNITIYGEYIQRNTNVNYNSFFVKVGTDHADLMYDSEIYTVGVYFTF